MPVNQDDTIETTGSSDVAAPLPLRKDLNVAALEPNPPQDRIEETIGGKITRFFTFYVIGFALNVALSLGITYDLNPRPGVKKFKDNAVSSLGKVFGNKENGKMLDSMRSGVEICFMFIAGTIATVIMTPLIKHRQEIAYKINKLLGKNTDILPKSMQPVPEAKTVEEKIEQEIDKRVKKHSAGDVWIARITTVSGILMGDFFVNRLSRKLEESGKPSVDTLSWSLGKQVYKIMPTNLIKGWNKWFTKHGAGIDDIRTNMADHFGRLEKHAGPDEDRMVVAEQTRLVTKEVGWSLVSSSFVEKLTGILRDKRIHRQEQKVIGEITREGLVPEGYNISVNHGRVTLTEPGTGQKTSSWATDTKSGEHTRPQKSDSHIDALAARAEDMQPTHRQ